MAKGDKDSQANVIRDEKGRWAKGGKPINGFDKRPEDRGRGYKKWEDTPRGMLEKMWDYTKDQLKAVYYDESLPYGNRLLAGSILTAKWKECREMITEVYGAPTQTNVNVGVDTTEEEAETIITKGFILP